MFCVYCLIIVCLICLCTICSFRRGFTECKHRKQTVDDVRQIVDKTLCGSHTARTALILTCVKLVQKKLMTAQKTLEMNRCGDLPLGTDRQRWPAVSDTRAFSSEETVVPVETSAIHYSCRPCSLQECRQTPVLFSQKMPWNKQVRARELLPLWKQLALLQYTTITV